MKVKVLVAKEDPGPGLSTGQHAFQSAPQQCDWLTRPRASRGILEPGPAMTTYLLYESAAGAAVLILLF